MDNQSQEQLLQRIARYLILHASFTYDIGLLYGKTGIALFFYHCARYMEKKVYEQFADKLVREVYKEIHLNSPFGFSDGLCGIGWGMEYLLQQQFVKGNADEVLEDLDRRIVERDVRRITDLSLETGLAGIACYVISRMADKTRRENPYFTVKYIEELGTALHRNAQIGCLYVDTLEFIIRKDVAISPYNPVCQIIKDIKFKEKAIFVKSRPLGIAENGYAGIGLQLMNVIKP
jgi:hypothetical protein